MNERLKVKAHRDLPPFLLPRFPRAQALAQGSTVLSHDDRTANALGLDPERRANGFQHGEINAQQKTVRRGQDMRRMRRAQRR